MISSMILCYIIYFGSGAIYDLRKDKYVTAGINLVAFMIEVGFYCYINLGKQDG